MKNLSKSKYTTFCQCPKALWLHINKPEEQVIDPSVQARFDAGSEVGELAKRLLGEFEDVTSYIQMPDGTQRLDLKAMIVKTQDCLNPSLIPQNYFQQFLGGVVDITICFPVTSFHKPQL